MCSEPSLVSRDDGFESVSLGDDLDLCDICLQDTGEAIRPCEICLKPYFDSATEGFNEIPNVIHKDQKGHERCFKKSHAILEGSIFIETQSSAGSSLTGTPKLTPNISPNISRKTFAENISDLASEVQTKVAENILWIFRRHCSPTRCRNRTITAPEKSSMSPQLGRKEFSDYARLSASMTNLNADHTESRTCRKIDGAELKQAKFDRRKSDGATGKTSLKLCVDDEHSHDALKLKRTDSWNRLKPKKTRNIVITVKDGDLDLKDIVEYSPKDLTEDPITMLTFQKGKHSKGQEETTKHGRQLSSSSIVEEEKKFPKYTEKELISMTKDELHALTFELSRRIHAISSKLVDLVQERHGLREEVDVRHIFIEKLLKLNLQAEAP